MQARKLAVGIVLGGAIFALSTTGWTQAPPQSERPTPPKSDAPNPIGAATPKPIADTTTSPTFSFPPPGEARILEERDLDNMLRSHGKRLLVVNFWATWCAPCVAEIPEFVEVAKQYRDKGVFFVGLSADFIDSWKTTVPPFLKQRKVDYPNFVLDVDPNAMIPKFSPDWSGSLPATFLFDRHGKKLSGAVGRMSKDDLIKAINAALAHTPP